MESNKKSSIQQNNNVSWIRGYKLLVGLPTDTAAKTTKDGAFKSTVDLDQKLSTVKKSDSTTLVIDNNHVEFNVKKNTSKDANQSVITIYNLSDDSVNYINKNLRNNLAVALAAGYQSQGEYPLIFKGTIQYVSDSFQGVDRKTDLHCLDGGLNLQVANTSRSFPKGTKLKQIITSLASDLGTTVGNITVDTDTAVSGATVFCGNTGEHLESVCRSINHTVSIQDGSVYVTPRDKRHENRIAYITPESGLIGSPQPFHNEIKPAKQVTKRTAKKQRPTDGVKFTMIMNGTLLPDKTVYLKTDKYDGAFKIYSVEHAGDYEGGKWTTTVEAVEVPGIIAQ